MRTKFFLLCITLILCGISMSAQKTVIIEEPTVLTSDSLKKTMKRKVAIGRFSNETEYGKGLFYDKENDPMGKQAFDILSAKLAASENFSCLNEMTSPQYAKKRTATANHHNKQSELTI